MKRNFLILALLALSVMACKKIVENQTQQLPERTLDAVTGSIERPFEHHFDPIGAEHNKTLEACWNNLQQTGDTTRSAKRKFLVQYYKENYGRDLEKTIDACAHLENKDVEEILAAIPFSANCKDLLRSIITSGELLKDESSLEAYQQAIQKIEADSQSMGLTKTESDAVLQVAAIARYSSRFWLDKITRFPPPGPQGKWYTWFLNLTADNMGGIVGLFGGDVQGEASYFSDMVTFYVH